MANITKRCLAEFIGTFFLVFMGAGAAAITLMITKGTAAPNAFNIGIGALGGLGDWLAIGLAFGFAIAAAIYALGNISGCHINPAVTIALWAVKKFPGRDVVPYIIAQLAGASVASLLFAMIVGMGAVTIGGLGATAPFPGIGYLQAMLAELVGTFLLMLAIMGVAVDRRAPPGFAGLNYWFDSCRCNCYHRKYIRIIPEPCKNLWTVPWRFTPGWNQLLDVLPNIHYRTYCGGCSSSISI